MVVNKKNLFIISGGQSGADRAALDFALKHRIKCGGWCTAGRIAEDGVIPDHYPLKEANSSDPEERTKKNVDDTHGTLIMLKDEPDMGTIFTMHYAKSKKKPLYIIKAGDVIKQNEFLIWLEVNKIKILNIAGPRESNQAGIYTFTLNTLKELFK